MISGSRGIQPWIEHTLLPTRFWESVETVLLSQPVEALMMFIDRCEDLPSVLGSGTNYDWCLPSLESGRAAFALAATETSALQATCWTKGR
jgi:hypothetical protein